MKDWPEDTIRGCEDCRKPAFTEHEYDGMRLCSDCLMQHEAEDAQKPVDPADVMLVAGYWSNLPQYAIDEIWGRHGKVMVAVSQRHRDAFQPADSVIYRMERRERNVDGADVECIEFDEVGRVLGTINEWYEE